MFFLWMSYHFVFRTPPPKFSLNKPKKQTTSSLFLHGKFRTPSTWIGTTQDLLTFRWMQEAELKHSRIAMVSVCLWPLSELDALNSQLQGGPGGPGVRGWLGDVGRWGLGVGVGWSCGDFFLQIGFCLSFLFFGCLWTHFKELFHVVYYQFQSTKLKPCRCRLCEFFTCLPSMKRLTKVWNSATPCPNIIQIYVLEDLQMQFWTQKMQSQTTCYLNTDILLMYFDSLKHLWNSDPLTNWLLKTNPNPRHMIHHTIGARLRRQFVRMTHCKVHGKW